MGFLVLELHFKKISSKMITTKNIYLSSCFFNFKELLPLKFGWNTTKVNLSQSTTRGMDQMGYKATCSYYLNVKTAIQYPLLSRKLIQMHGSGPPKASLS